MFVELDTSIAGACLWLKALADTNVLDCLGSETLLRELYRRNEDPSTCVYQRESPDVWTAFAVYCSRIKPTQKIVADCEDFAGMRGAYRALRYGACWVCITQPGGEGMAHAYNRKAVPDGLGGWAIGDVSDMSVECGMRDPRAGFYDDPTAETACLLVRVPK